MTNPLTSNLDWSNWLYGLGAGFIGGGATAVTSGVTLNMVDSKDFNIYSSKFYVMVGSIFLVNGLMNMFMYLKQNPLPAHTTVTKMEQTTTAPDTTTKTVVEKTEITNTKEGGKG